MPKSNKPSVCCLPPSNEQGQPGPPSSISAPRDSSSHAAFGVVLRQENSIGCQGTHHGVRHPCFVTRATLVRSVSDGPRPANILMARCTPKPFPRSSGCFSFKKCMLASTRWEDYEANLAQLRANGQAHGEDRRHGPPREGPALQEAAFNLRTASATA